MLETFISSQVGQYSDWVILIARVIVGATMVYYGLPKIRDLKKNAEDFNNMGFKPGWFFGTMIAVIEFFGGLMIVLGIYLPIVAILFAGQMLVGTIWKIIKTKKTFKDWSYDLILLALMLLLVLTGPGAFIVF